MDHLLKLDQICCGYSDNLILNDLSFNIEKGAIACLLGPSGSGKTTALQAIAGFNPLLSGTITLDRDVISSAESMLVPEKRKISMVFQDYALFPHLTVQDNISFGLRSLSRRDRKNIVDEMLELVRLPSFGKRYPHELSGGQQQRVALARGLATHPLLLLMDEPFSNLDAGFKRQLYTEVRDILKDMGITTLVVTHDKEEAFTVSDQVGVLANGQLQQWGSPAELFHQPCNRQVATFIGAGQLIPALAIRRDQLKTEIGMITLFNGQASLEPGEQCEIFIRPHELNLGTDAKLVQGEVIRKQFLGSKTRYTMGLPSGNEINVVTYDAATFEVGAKVGLKLETDNLILFQHSTTTFRITDRP